MKKLLEKLDAESHSPSTDGKKVEAAKAKTNPDQDILKVNRIYNNFRKF